MTGSAFSIIKEQTEKFAAWKVPSSAVRLSSDGRLDMRSQLNRSMLFIFFNIFIACSIAEAILHALLRYVQDYNSIYTSFKLSSDIS